MDLVFRLGTGWLGWTPEQTYDTPMPQLFLALDGRIDFLKKTNPFAAPEKKKPADPELIKKHQSMLDSLNAKAKAKIGNMKNV